jgi:hypothetical protein
VYRNIEGRVDASQLDRWMTKALELGLTIVEETRGKIMTITLVQGDDMVAFNFFGSGGTYETRIDYLRLQHGETPWEECLDSLIALGSLSGEKHIILDGQRTPMYFQKGAETVSTHSGQTETGFELMLMKETLQGKINLCLDQYRVARARNDQHLQETLIKEMKAYLYDILALEEQIRMVT